MYSLEDLQLSKLIRIIIYVKLLYNMKKSEVIIDINTQKENLIERLHCFHGYAVLKELQTQRRQHHNYISTSFFLNEEFLIDKDPKYLFMQETDGEKKIGVIVSAFNDYCHEMAKALYFDVLDKCIDEYDVSLNKTGRVIYAKTDDKHDVFDVVSHCQTYLDIWNCLKGKRIRISAFVPVNGARFNRSHQIVGVRTFNMPVFSFIVERKTNDGKFWGPVKKCIVCHEGLFKSSSFEGNTTFTYYYDKFGFLQKIEGYDNGEFVTDVYEYRRNDKGKIVEMLYPDGNLKKYYYKDTDCLIVSKTMLIDEKGGIREIKEFDRNGNMIKETYMGSNTISDELTYEYDEQNRLIKMEHGEYYYRYFYNRIGQLEKKISYHSQNNKNELCHTIIYKYSPNGLLIEKNEESSYYYIGRTKTEYKYNTQNLLVEEIVYRNHPPKDDFEGLSRHKYRYDQYGNRLYNEHSDFDEQQVFSRIMIEIEYY